ncbi:MAG: shikimate dehydrogenase [Corynebacterium camporealensis]|uniref:shikimate dehydrogenase n=1 Tax=Corynebacterium camporealensis TaxID=161896 RepID=UPI002A916D63|nr:shikimate dehydrogenase [Corynebacterium camporealensis]MDY5840067.1 shikimate dehydrogenase [Corynebacterium camporealensis]
MAGHRAAVLGQPIAHSLSPLLHNVGYKALELNGWDYTRFEVDAEGLPELVSNAGDEFVGFSVTMPCKFAALEFADTATERAQLIGSANTLVRTAEGWRADNTDTEGVLGALGELLDDDAEPTRALLIGSGGTARPALWALAQRGVRDVTVLNRSDRLAELQPLADALDINIHGANFNDDLRELSVSADVMISTVPSAAVEDHLQELTHAHTLDVIYDPWPTPLVVHAAADGYRTVGGHVMLAHQAFSQFQQFTGHPAPRAEMFEALEAEIKKPTQDS